MLNFTAGQATQPFISHSILDVFSFIKTGKTDKALQTYLYNVPLNDD